MTINKIVAKDFNEGAKIAIHVLAELKKDYSAPLSKFNYSIESVTYDVGTSCVLSVLISDNNKSDLSSAETNHNMNEIKRLLPEYHKYHDVVLPLSLSYGRVSTTKM